LDIQILYIGLPFAEGTQCESKFLKQPAKDTYLTYKFLSSHRRKTYFWHRIFKQVPQARLQTVHPCKTRRAEALCMHQSVITAVGNTGAQAEVRAGRQAL